jgi:hypothetical protein
LPNADIKISLGTIIDKHGNRLDEQYGRCERSTAEYHVVPNANLDKIIDQNTKPRVKPTTIKNQQLFTPTQSNVQPALK